MSIDFVEARWPLRVGLVGTGYAAKRRAEALQADPRAHLVAVAGHRADTTEAFCRTYDAIAASDWHELVQRADLDLVIVATINRDHGAIARAALAADKHVVVEYPLSLDPIEAGELIALAQARQRLLHVEHIELLGGVHQALKTALPDIGTPFYARYATLKPERPAPQRWSYHLEQFGFPLAGALSRLHRLTDLFGSVATVNCQTQFWDQTGQPITEGYYATCLCAAQLRFDSGVLAEVVYGKGEAVWVAERKFTIEGRQGALVLDGEQGTLIQAQGNQPLVVAGRRGLFAQDTARVLEALATGAPLYVTPEASLYTLKVALAAQQSAATGQVVRLTAS